MNWDSDIHTSLSLMPGEALSPRMGLVDTGSPVGCALLHMQTERQLAALAVSLRQNTEKNNLMM